MLTQLTYQGLIAQVYGIEYGYSKLDMTLLDNKPENQGKTFNCDFQDEIFKEIKDANVKTLSKTLMRDLIEAKQFIKNQREGSKNSEGEMERLKVMVEKGKRIKAIELHLNLCFDMLTRMKERHSRAILAAQQVGSS